MDSTVQCVVYSVQWPAVMKQFLLFALCVSSVGYLTCFHLVIRKPEVEFLLEAEYLIAASLKHTESVLDCSLQLICRESGNTESDLVFFTGFTQLAGVFNKMTEAEQTLFPLVKSVSEAVNTAGRDCEDIYNCVYEGDEAEIFEQILQSGEHKSRYPRQADSQYYPSNETESVNSSLKKETEENSEEGSKAGFTSKLKGYYDKAKDSLSEGFTKVGGLAKNNCGKIKEYTKFIGCPAGSNIRKNHQIISTTIFRPDRLWCSGTIFRWCAWPGLFCHTQCCLCFYTLWS